MGVGFSLTSIKSMSTASAVVLRCLSDDMMFTSEGRIDAVAIIVANKSSFTCDELQLSRHSITLLVEHSMAHVNCAQFKR